MNPHYTYLLLDAATMLGPLLLSFDKKVAFYRHWPRLFAAICLVGGAFIAWDAGFTKSGVWEFNNGYLVGLYWLNLPVEEWLFFLVVPYSCIFIYACLRAYWPGEKRRDSGWQFLLVLAIVLLTAAGINHQRAYTFCACGGCGALCLLTFLFRKKIPHFRADAFLLSWAICLLPFLLVNGVLTALPVVIYNDNENTGLRIYTIPAEDIAYGMLLVMSCALAIDPRTARVVKTSV